MICLLVFYAGKLFGKMPWLSGGVSKFVRAAATTVLGPVHRLCVRPGFQQCTLALMWKHISKNNGRTRTEKVGLLMIIFRMLILHHSMQQKRSANERAGSQTIAYTFHFTPLYFSVSDTSKYCIFWRFRFSYDTFYNIIICWQILRW